MSLKKQIQRNIDKLNKEELKKYEPFLKPNWRSLPNEDLNVFANLARNGITVSDLNREVEKARKQAYQDTVTSVMQVMYACVALVLNEEYDFSAENCLEALGKIDHRMALTIDNEEVIKEMENRLGIRFNSADGVERVEIV